MNKCTYNKIRELSSNVARNYQIRSKLVWFGFSVSVSKISPVMKGAAAGILQSPDMHLLRGSHINKV